MRATLDQGQDRGRRASGRRRSARGSPDTELSLACQAISIALDDAGIAPSEVDGLASYTLEPNREVDVARNVGLGDITFFSQVGFGGGAGCGVVGHAAMAVATGQCRRRGRVAGPQAGRRGEPAVGAGRRPASPTASSGPGRSASSGRSTRSRCSPAATCTSTAQRATTSPTSRSRSASTRPATPSSTMGHKPLTRDDYMNARWISEPLCLFDNCLETDGALAVVVDVGRAGARSPAAARVHPRVRAGPAAAAPDDDQLLHRGPAARPGVDRGRASCGRTPT